MPRPRKSPKMVEKGFPFGKLSNLVLSIYSTLSGLAVIVLPSTCMCIVFVGEFFRR
uniref:Uncharacterized protein n=1 Tax=Rhizophora mucronata TaxID=61149 RepID=A0A2P2N555_RHIMU